MKKNQSQSNMRLTQRLVNSRRHTVGYVSSGKTYTVAEVRRLAQSGRVAGVQVVGNHVQATPGSRKLAGLPTKVVRV